MGRSGDEKRNILWGWPYRTTDQVTPPNPSSLSLKNQRFFAVIECDYIDNKAQGKATGNQNVI